jgi:hypothetical protein
MSDTEDDLGPEPPEYAEGRPLTQDETDDLIKWHIELWRRAKGLGKYRSEWS